MIRLQGVTKVYLLGKRELAVLRGIDLEVKRGEMVAIMGPSGSGKTTLLNIIGCLDKPTSGSYFLEGNEVSRLSSGELAKVRGQKVGFVFQTFNLLPYLSAFANVELGMRYSGGSDGNRAREALAKLDSLTGLITAPTNSPEVNSRGWPLPGPWRKTHPSSWLMSQRETWTAIQAPK